MHTYFNRENRPPPYFSFRYNAQLAAPISDVSPYLGLIKRAGFCER
jgi:hypothetical protein